MSGGIEKNERAAADMIPDVFADVFACDDVVPALEDQCAGRDVGQIRPVVGGEGRTRELICDPRIGPAEALRQFLPEFRSILVTHDRWSHGGGPRQRIVSEGCK